MAGEKEIRMGRQWRRGKQSNAGPLRSPGLGKRAGLLQNLSTEESMRGRVWNSLDTHHVLVSGRTGVSSKQLERNVWEGEMGEGKRGRERRGGKGRSEGEKEGGNKGGRDRKGKTLEIEIWMSSQRGQHGNHELPRKKLEREENWQDHLPRKYPHCGMSGSHLALN